MDEIVVACLAPADQRPEIDALTGTVLVHDTMASLSPADSAALEYALRAGESWGTRVFAIAAGAAWAEPALREAAAAGAHVLRVAPSATHEPGEGPRRCDGAELAGDPEGLASALAVAIEGLGKPALVVCGDRSSLSGSGSVPAMLAHHLGAAQALGSVSLRFEPGGVVLAERRLDGGWRERIRLSSPAVCSVEAAGVRLRRAPLDAALSAASVPIRVVAAPAGSGAGDRRVHAGAPRSYRPRTKLVPPPAGGTHDRIVALTGALAHRDPPRVVGPLGAKEAARELLDFLQRAEAEIS
jgi:electron transfer flavoprotein beta subunit